MAQQTIVDGRAPPTDTATDSTAPPVGGEPTGAAHPLAVRAAVWLMLAGALATMVAFLAWIPSADGVRAQAQDTAGRFAEMAGRVAVVAFWTGIVLTGVVMIGSWLWLARASGRGRSWARTAAVTLVGVFSGFMVLSAFGVATLELGTIGAWAALIAWIAGLAAVALLFSEDATAYYAGARKN